jgi:molybdopterin converting factor small subunit
MVRRVRVLLFATARAAVGAPEIEWSVPARGLSVRDLIIGLTAQYPALGQVVGASRFVRNGRYVIRESERVRPGDEFAVHPPYSGG